MLIEKCSSKQRTVLLLSDETRAVTYQPHKRTIITGEKGIRVSKTLNTILGLLTQRPLQVVKREEIYRKCLNLDEDHATADKDIKSYLKPFIHRLKVRLEHIHPNLGRSIRSAYGSGYMFIPDSSVQENKQKSDG